MSRFAQLVVLCAIAGSAAISATAGQSATSANAGGTLSFADLRDFDSVTLAGPDNVVVTRASSFSVRAEGDPKAIDKLDITVRDGVLRISRKRQDRDGWRWNGDKGATIRVTLPMLRSAKLAGSGDMSVNSLTGAKVEALVSGSGDLRISGVEAQEARLALAGSGTLTIAGRARATTVSIAGSGDVLADGLASLNSEVSIAGSGNAHVRASEAAQVSIIGSGDAMIKGTSNCKLSKIGSGDAHCSV